MRRRRSKYVSAKQPSRIGLTRRTRRARPVDESLCLLQQGVRFVPVMNSPTAVENDEINLPACLLDQSSCPSLRIDNARYFLLDFVDRGTRVQLRDHDLAIHLSDGERWYQRP